MIVKKHYIDNIIIILCSCFTVGIFAPLEIFFMNSSNIWFDIYDILFPVSVYFVGICLVALLPIVCLSILKAHKILGLYTYVLGCIVLIFYLIGSFAPIHMSMVDEGDTINWLNPKYNVIHAVIILCCVIVCAVLFSNKKRQAITAGVLQGIFLVQCLTLITISLFSPGEGWRHRDEMILSQKNFQTYSKDLNMEILILDEFDGRVMTELLKDDTSYLSDLDGFTLYPDTVSKYNFSDCSVVQIMTGKDFIHQTDYNEFLNEAYKSSYLFNRLNAEYSINAYEDIEQLPPEMMETLFDNYVKVDMKISSNRTLMKYMYKLVGCKYLPFYFRQYCWFASDDLDQLKYVEAVDEKSEYGDRDITETPCTAANTKFFVSIQDMELVDEKMFHLHHLRGLHKPRTHDSNMMDTQDADIMECARGVMLLLDTWINELKDKGVYDNHIIIIMADHGTQIDPSETFRSSNALFMVKGYDEHHELHISDKKVSYDELDEIYGNLLDGKKSDESVKGLSESENRIFYKGIDGYYENGDLVEYVVPKTASDVKSIYETGIVYK